MLFDLRGRGRRRTVQVDLPLARPAHGRRPHPVRDRRRHQRRPLRRHRRQRQQHHEHRHGLQEAARRLRAPAHGQPADTAALLGLTKLHFGNASTGENFNQTQRLHREASRAAPGLRGLAALPRANPAKPDADTATSWSRPTARPASSSTTRPSRPWRSSSTAARRPRTSTPSSPSWPPAPNRTARRACRGKGDRPRAKAKDRKQLKSEIDLQKSQLRSSSRPASERLTNAPLPLAPRPCSSTGRAADS